MAHAIVCLYRKPSTYYGRFRVAVLILAWDALSPPAKRASFVAWRCNNVMPAPSVVRQIKRAVKMLVPEFDIDAEVDKRALCAPPRALHIRG